MASHLYAGHLYRRGQTVLFALCLLACTSNDPMNAWHLAAPSDQQPVAPGSVTNLPGCATVTVEVSGSNKVTAHFPVDSACKSGLVLIPGGAPTYDRPITGRVTLPVRVLNRSGAGILAPANLTLAEDSAVVLLSPGLASNGKKGVAALSPDSAATNGAAWLVGASGVTNGGDSTAARQLAFSWADGVQLARMSFMLSAEPADTSRPVVPATFTYPSDSLYLVQNPSDTQWIYLRRFAIVAFKKSATGAAVRQFFARHHATIVGGLRTLGDYVVQFPDPGASWSAYSAFVDSVNADPAVRYVTPISWRGAKPQVNSLYPTEGSGVTRASWNDGRSTTTWALRAIRAPLAWGCESGTESDATLADVGVLEWGFENPQQKELQRSSPSVFTASHMPLGAALPDEADLLGDLWHGSAVAGVVSAAGDDSAGTAGVLWKSKLHLYGLGMTRQAVVRDAVVGFASEIIDQMIADNIRILSISSILRTDTRFGTEDSLVYDAWDNLMDRLPNLLIIKATGNDGVTLTYDQLKAHVFGSEATLLALTTIATNNPERRSRILLVAGTDTPNGDLAHSRYWRSSTFIRGFTDIVAPADSVWLLGSSDPVNALHFGETTIDSGTSFAAPLVAGVAAQLATFDPTLTASQIRSYILDGARLSKPDPAHFPTLISPSPVSGAPEPVYQLDAYSSLTLAARKAGTPLCGNRVWIAGGQVMAERDGVDEVLHDFGQQMDVVFAHHGGRRISLESAFPYYQETAMAQDASGHWAEVPFAEDSTIPSFSGAALSAFGYSHDHDSSATIQENSVTYGAGEWSPRAPAVTVALPALQLAPGSQGACVQDTATTSNGQFTGYDCSAYGEVNREEVLGDGVAWSPIGGTLLAYRAIGYFSTVPTDSMLPCSADSVQGHPRQRCAPVAQPISSVLTEVSTVDLAKQDVVSVDTIQGMTIRSLGVSEDGTSIVTEALTYTGALDDLPTSCAYEYRAVADIGATLPARRINEADLCDVFYDDDGGGFSAVRGYASQSGAPGRTTPGVGASYYGALIARLFPQATRLGQAPFLHR